MVASNEPFEVPGVSDWVRTTQQPGSLAYTLFGGAPPITPTGRSQPRGGVDKTPANAGYGATDWWTQGGHQWQGNQTIQRNPTTSVGVGLPDWAQGSYADPRSFYEAYQTLDPSLRPFFVGSLQSAAAAQQKEEAARDAAIGTLTDQREGVAQALGDYQSDPNRQMVLDRYAAMSAPDYAAITPEETRAMRQRIAQGYARAQQAAEVTAAGRGAGAGGVGTQRMAQLQGGADARGVEIDAQVAAANAAARQRALEVLQGAQGDEAQIELAYNNLLSGLSDQIAGYQTSLDYVPTDNTLWGALDEAKRQAESGEEFRDEQLAAAEAESEDSIWDYVFRIADTFPGAAGNLVSSLFGG